MKEIDKNKIKVIDMAMDMIQILLEEDINNRGFTTQLQKVIKN